MHQCKKWIPIHFWGNLKLVSKVFHLGSSKRLSVPATDSDDDDDAKKLSSKDSNIALPESIYVCPTKKSSTPQISQSQGVITTV